MSLQEEIRVYIDESISRTVRVMLEPYIKRIEVLENGNRDALPFFSVFNDTKAGKEIIEALIDAEIITEISQEQYRIIADAEDTILPIVCLFSLLRKSGYLKHKSIRQYGLAFCKAFGLAEGSVRMFYDYPLIAEEKYRYIFHAYIPSFKFNYSPKP
jgi:hypothetical protein